MVGPRNIFGTVFCAPPILEFVGRRLAGDVAGIFGKPVFSGAILATFQVEAAAFGDGDEAPVDQKLYRARRGIL